MNAKELMEILQEVVENGHGDKEIRLAIQPGYRITEKLQGVAGPDQFLDYVERLDEEEAEEQRGDDFVWLVSGGQPVSWDESPYAPGWVDEVDLLTSGE